MREKHESEHSIYERKQCSQPRLCETALITSLRCSARCGTLSLTCSALCGCVALATPKVRITRVCKQASQHVETQLSVSPSDALMGAPFVPNPLSISRPQPKSPGPKSTGMDRILCRSQLATRKLRGPQRRVFSVSSTPMTSVMEGLVKSGVELLAKESHFTF